MAWLSATLLIAALSPAALFSDDQWERGLQPPQQLADIAANVSRFGGEHRRVIVTTTSVGYIGATVNWLVWMSRLGLERNVLIVAVDAEARDFFNNRNWAAIYMPTAMDTGYLDHEKGRTHWTRMHVWFERTRVVRQLLGLGYQVLHSDADALWFKDPIQELNSLIAMGNDLVFSRGNAASGRASGHGVGVCMGFFVAAATDASRDTLTEALKVMQRKNMPDQPAVISVLWPGGNGRSPDALNPDVWFGTARSESGTPTKFALLPQSRFARHAGVNLNSLSPGSVDLHVFHPVDEGYHIPMTYLPDLLNSRTEIPKNESIKSHCGVGRWFEKIVFRKNEQKTQHCAGLWMLKKFFKYGAAKWPALSSADQSWHAYLQSLSLLDLNTGMQVGRQPIDS